MQDNHIPNCTFEESDSSTETYYLSADAGLGALAHLGSKTYSNAEDAMTPEGSWLEVKVTRHGDWKPARSRNKHQRVASPSVAPPVKSEAEPPAREWIRPPEWSRRTGMSRTETYRLIHSGRLRARQVSKKMVFIPASELVDFFEREGENRNGGAS